MLFIRNMTPFSEINLLYFLIFCTFRCAEPNFICIFVRKFGKYQIIDCF